MPQFLFKLLLLFLVYKCFFLYRLEPIGLFNSRVNFYKNNTNGNFFIENDHRKGIFCKSTKDINRGEELIKIAKNLTYSTFDNFPLKNDLYYLLNEIELILEQPSLVGKMLLTLRVMFDLKANMTETLLMLKKKSYKTIDQIDVSKAEGNFY
jgi:hypothetical protein